MDRRSFLKNTGWSFLGLAASGSLLGSCVAGSKEAKKIMPSASNLKVFWGDLHNHCNLTYGHGDMRDAFEAAKGQLDFVSVTPHAMWPDIPGANDPRLKWVIDYHTGAFKRLREGGYEKYVKMSNEYNKEGEFLTFIGYEAHSMEHGDHVALNYDLDAPLVECTSIEDWKEKAKGHKVFVTPHHMGYQGGYRGYNWKCFTEGDITPFVEMYSRHGLAESDQGDYPYLHDMGPRQWEGTIQYGLEQGHKFGIMASTDQHSGYPGSYGDGRIGVLAPSLTRDAIWEALRTRHVCAATGDKIIIDFRLNDAFMGDVVRGNSRRIYLNVTGESCIDYVDVVKNGQILARMNGPLTPVAPEGDKSGFRLESRRALCALARQAVCQQGPYRKRYPLLPRRCLHLSSGGRNRIQDTCQPHPLRRREGNGTGLVQQQEPEYHHRSHAGGNPRPGDAERRRAHRRLQRQEVRTHTGRTARRFTFALHDRLVERSHSL